MYHFTLLPSPVPSLSLHDPSAVPPQSLVPPLPVPHASSSVPHPLRLHVPFPSFSPTKLNLSHL
ncbi:MAG: hypothetical protein ACK56I_32960, partial [bacterium]